MLLTRPRIHASLPAPTIEVPAPRVVRPSRRRWSTGRELAQFVVAGILALVVLAVSGLSAMHRMAVHEAVSQAREMSVNATRFVVAPAVTDGLVAGHPADLAAFDSVIRQQILHDRVVRVKLWTAAGRIVYSDDTRLVGRTFPLEADDLETLRTGAPAANLSDLTSAENELERSSGRLLQVYNRVTTPGGQQLLFEIYLRFDSVLASSRNLVRQIVPAFLLALLALQVLQLPLAWRLLRRVQHGQREREALQRRALEASDIERARIARDLHDGVVQKLVGVAYALSASADQLRPSHGRQAWQIDRAAEVTRSGAAELRTLISDINPPSLQVAGLLTCLADLLGAAEEQGLRTELVADAEPRVSPDVRAALFRAAQEAVRNVISHARADTLRIEVVVGPRTVAVVVEDDGIGLRDSGVDESRPHLGISLLEGLAHEIGGDLEVADRVGGGTRFRFELPRR